MKTGARPSVLARELGEIFAAVSGAEEMAVFLEGMLTPSELEEVMCRWRLMLKLEAGETQREIARDLGISLGKISRGSRLLKYGSTEFAEILAGIRGRLDQ